MFNCSQSWVSLVSIQGHEEFASRWAWMWTSRHLEPLLALFAPQAIYTNAYLHIHARGMSELRRQFSRILHGDLEVTAGIGVRHDGSLVLEWTRQGTRILGAISPDRVRTGGAMRFTGHSKMMIGEDRILKCDDDWSGLARAIEKLYLGGLSQVRRVGEIVRTPEGVRIGGVFLKNCKPI